jgi:hypothetical protein
LRAEKYTTFGAFGVSGGYLKVVELLKEEHIKAGFITTPTRKLLEYLRSVSGPLAIASADDQVFGVLQPSQGTWDPNNTPTTEEMVLKTMEYPYRVTTYSHVNVSFAMRRAMKTEAELFAKKAVFVQAIAWFTEFVYRTLSFAYFVEEE